MTTLSERTVEDPGAVVFASLGLAVFLWHEFGAAGVALALLAGASHYLLARRHVEDGGQA